MPHNHGKLRLGVVIEETWDFFREIYAQMQQSYPTTLFKRRALRSGPFHTRINRFMLERDLQSFMHSQDVVFFEWASELLVAATHLPKTCGIVTRLHRYELYQWADHVNWDAVDRIILVSHAKQREFCERYPTQAAKTIVSSPSTSLEKFTYQPRPFAGRIGTLCHLTPRKRVYDLILAFAELAEQDASLTLHIAGGPNAGFLDYARSLHFIVEQLKLQERVTFYGNVSEAWNWYRTIDIFVSNSYSEGLQVAPMEAMACGCYTLSHAWEGAEELVPLPHLFTTSRDLQQKVLAYCALPEAARQAEAAAMRAFACEHFDIHKTVQDVLSAIDEVAAGRKRVAT